MTSIKENSPVAETKGTVVELAKFISWVMGLATVVSGLFGLACQKAMILGMKLGNLSGNYEIEEVYNSAVIGYFWLYKKLLETDFLPILAKDIYSDMVFFILSFGLFYVTHFYYSNPKKAKSHFEKLDSGFFYLFGNSVLPRLLASFIGATLAIMTKVMGVILTYAGILLLLSFLLLPSITGYIVGEKLIQSKIEHNTCETVSLDEYKNKYVHQCPHLKVRGKEVKGEIIFENQEAYYISVNDGFLYMAKENDTCMYSKYELTELFKKSKEEGFKKSQLDEICPMTNS